MKPKYAQTTILPGSWKLPKNNIWNIPEKPINEVRFQIEQSNNFAGTIISLTALVIDSSGKIYGIRKAREIKEDGYCSRGRVSVNGKKVKCFTSSKLFEREDGSLCNVAVLWI